MKNTFPLYSFVYYKNHFVLSSVKLYYGVLIQKYNYVNGKERSLSLKLQLFLQTCDRFYPT